MCKDVLTLTAFSDALYFVSIFVVIVVVHVSGAVINGYNVVGAHAAGVWDFEDIVFGTATLLSLYLIGRGNLRIELFKLLTA